MSELEKLFLLEILVDYVSYEGEYEGLKETCVAFKFLNYPPILICEDASQDNEVEFNSGKSCLFSIHGNFLKKNVDLQVDVTRKGANGEDVFMGTTIVPLGSSFVNLFESTSNTAEEPQSKTVRDHFIISDEQNRNIGKMGVLVRLSCFGSLIVTQFEVKSPEEHFIFKNEKINSKSDYVSNKSNFEPERSEPNPPPTCQPCQMRINPFSPQSSTACPCQSREEEMKTPEVYQAKEYNYYPRQQPQYYPNQYPLPPSYSYPQLREPDYVQKKPPCSDYCRPPMERTRVKSQSIATFYNIQEIPDKEEEKPPQSQAQEKPPEGPLREKPKETPKPKPKGGKKKGQKKKTRTKSETKYKEVKEVKSFDVPVGLRGPRPGDLMCWGGTSGDGPEQKIRAIWVAEEIKGSPDKLCWVGREVDKEIDALYPEKAGQHTIWTSKILPSTAQNQRPIDLTSKIMLPTQPERQVYPSKLQPREPPILAGRGDGMIPYYEQPMVPYVPVNPYVPVLGQMSCGMLPTVSSMSFGGKSESSSESESEYSLNFCDCDIPLPPFWKKPKKKRKTKEKEVPICAVTCGDPRCCLNQFTSPEYKCTPIASRGAKAKLSLLANQSVFNTGEKFITEPKMEYQGPCPTYAISNNTSQPQRVQVVEPTRHKEDIQNDTFLLNMGKTDSSGKPANLNLTFKTPRILSTICTNDSSIQCVPEVTKKKEKTKTKKKGKKKKKKKEKSKGKNKAKKSRGKK